MQKLILAFDLDNMMFSYPNQLTEIVKSLQAQGNKCGVLTARPMSQKEELTPFLQEKEFNPDFFIGKPEEFNEISNGCFKGLVCLEGGVDVLFDDFQCSDPQMIADFFATNEGRTLPFTSWAYKP